MIVDTCAQFAYKKSAGLLGTKTLREVPQDLGPSQLRRSTNLYRVRAAAVLLT
jgi:hypothetical protein